jgi:hypothetical protein
MSHREHRETKEMQYKKVSRIETTGAHPFAVFAFSVFLALQSG